MSIPVWEVSRIEGYQESGRTRPLQVSAALTGAEGERLERRELLVKARGLPAVTETGLFCEYFGSQLAVEFGLDAPVPVIVNISADLLDASRDSLRSWGLAPRSGEAVGVEFFRGLAPLNRFAPVGSGRGEVADALRIYAFDMLVQNPDRRDDNPNCARYRGRFLAYDFEMAFSFLYPLVGALLDPAEIPAFATQHVFYRSLVEASRRGVVDLQPVGDALNRVGERVEELGQFLPARWASFAARVVSHIRAVQARADVFEDGLRRSLA